MAFSGVVFGQKAESKNQSFTFVQICDPQLGVYKYEKDKENFRQAVRQVNLLKPDLVVICGDLVHDGSEKAFKDFVEIKNGFKMPCYCVPGNHDFNNKLTAEGLARYREAIGKDHFAVEHKGASFIFINTQLWMEPLEGETEKQDAWLEEELKGACQKGNQIFIVEHYPLFVKKADERSSYKNLPKEKRLALLELFKRYHVAAVVGGHLHRVNIKTYENILMVNGEATSQNFDKRPLGFRVWTVGKGVKPEQEFVALDKPLR